MDLQLKLPVLLPRELPITAHADEIESAVRQSQVVIVSGDTGSGKTTQLPKIALNAGRGRRGLIGCTQPRRLAACAMADRVAAELGGNLGGFVGYQHRFDKVVSRDTRIKFMTDGILLAETRRDRYFKHYDTLIIDEAHERSLNIDFLLGILKQVLDKRRDLRIIISSATLDVQRFATFFNDAPVIQVPGRLYPIELRWRPPSEGDESDLPTRVADACDEVICSGPGDILVFLAGEHDIRDVAETLRGRQLPETEIIPLLASLPAAEQARAFKLSSKRRVILSTNVAETSVTVPGIRYVIDSGLARISRYSHRSQVQRLLIEPISRASADQRMGRCGRIAPGICVRLYDEQDFSKRDKFTPPEILRTSLAGVILTMMDLNLGAIEEFPFLEPPSTAIIKEGYRRLALLDAIKPVSEKDSDDSAWRLTRLGRNLAHLPVGPVLGAILFAADNEMALRDTLIVVAGLECDNPKRRPIDKKQEADRCHARFLAPNSDFSAMLKLWRWYAGETKGGSQSRIRKLCKENYLSYPKMREWIDLHAQLRDICRGLRMDVESHTGGEDGMHRALLRGLIANIGKRDPETGEYQGTRGTRFSIFPGSGLFRVKERKIKMEQTRQSAHKGQLSRDWIVANDLVDTSRLFARQAACIAPQWIESVAKHHCKFQYWGEQWDARRGFVTCKERVTFQGVVIADGRNRDLGGIDPQTARGIFIREGLVLGEFPAPLPTFLKKNLELCKILRDADAKTRRSNDFFDPEPFCRFYEERLPSAIHSAAGLRRWLKGSEERQRNQMLLMKSGDLPDVPKLQNDFPDNITVKECRFKLSYFFETGAEDDGLTCEVPVALLPVAAQWPSEWLVQGMLDEKLRWMLSVLPAKYRRLLQPLDETIAQCRSVMKQGQGSLTAALVNALYQVRSVRVTEDVWERDDWPPHLLARYLVYSEDGQVLGTGRDINSLLHKFGSRESEARRAPLDQRWHMTGLTEWTFEELPETVDVGHSGWPLINYPTLVDEGSSVGVRLFAEREAALTAHRNGIGRLYAMALGKSFKRYLQPPSLPRDAILYLPHLEQSAAELGVEIGMAALHQCFTDGLPVIRSRGEFQQRLENGYGALHNAHTQRTRLVVAVLRAGSELDSLLRTSALPDATREDLMEQLGWLVYPGFAGTLPLTVLEHYPRYFEACRIRIQRAQANPDADLRRAAEVTPHWRRYADYLMQKNRASCDQQKLDDYRWMVEEFRVSLFAQELKTAFPVSGKRLNRLWGELFSGL